MQIYKYRGRNRGISTRNTERKPSTFRRQGKLYLQKIKSLNPLRLAISVIIILLAIFFLKNRLKKFFTWIKNIFRSTGSSLNDEQAAYKSKLIFDAMNIAGTKENVIKAALISTSKSDFYKISNAFGVKTYGLTNSSLFGTSLDMKGWLIEELNTNDIDDINKDVPYFKSVLGV